MVVNIGDLNADAAVSRVEETRRLQLRVDLMEPDDAVVEDDFAMNHGAIGEALKAPGREAERLHEEVVASLNVLIRQERNDRRCVHDAHHTEAWKGSQL